MQNQIRSQARSQTEKQEWWRDAVIYQVYPRSFADGNGDGVGDLAGIRNKLPYLQWLGVDALWLNPWYASPMADAGYDVADYRRIDPLFGTLGEAESLIAEARALGIRIIVDVVPNHVSKEHPWFQAALAKGPDAPERRLFWFRQGRGKRGELPPTQWVSPFGGNTWTRTPDGQWYLHLFDSAQPDLNWEHPAVRAELESVLRFWFDRGASGIRIDSAALLAKDPSLPEVHEVSDGSARSEARAHPFTDRDEVHAIYRAWRRIAEGYGGDRALIGEVWLPDRERFVQYLRPDELHTAFNFDFLCCPWDALRLRAIIEGTLASHAAMGAPPTWVLSNHDVTRHITRYGRDDTSFRFGARRHGTPVDLRLGTRRARAAILLALALPGSAYIYQGEELGLWEVEDIRPELRQDPIWHRTGHVDPGRDGCRIPLPWSGEAPPFGFSPPHAIRAPWLPQPAAWRALTMESQAGDRASMLTLYRRALRWRRILRGRGALGDGTLTWLEDHDAHDGVLAFSRTGPRERFVCITNLSNGVVPLPAHHRVLLASGSLDGDLLSADTTVWLCT
ncbi:alpha-amylase family glycosyl hydrolase [Pendulispora albinea]|uniref:Glycoside hydrolase family 13 protein n=1 Tax=Pendulispora albinea TaxID=2741071 RepID=A0ABZ2M0Y1_9BACT